MDAYPGDLLTGAFPLAFAADSILPTSTPYVAESSATNEVDSNADDVDTDPVASLAIPRSSTRSLFDRFLDAMASNLVEEDVHMQTRQHNSSPKTNQDTFSSLLRGDYSASSISGPGDDSSGEEENVSMDSGSRRFRVGIGSPSLSMAMRPISPRREISESTAYAKSLKLDGFFDRARIVSISNRHGFPPAKDPTGHQNRSFKLSQARSALAMSPTNANALRLKRVMDMHPIEGILPSGWLEKHSAALPSIIIVVTSFQIDDKEAQEQQDQYALETIQHLRESLAPKRECSIRMVCLADTPDRPTTPAKVDEWVSRMKRATEHKVGITMLSIPYDLNDSTQGSAIDTPFQKLHTQVRDASWSYYQSQCRRVKSKLTMLGHDQQPTLLPLAVRYCFKIAVFYEILLKHSKSIKFYMEAYRHLQTYYRQLVAKSLVWNPMQTTEVSQDDDGNIELAAGDTDRPHPMEGENAGVEVALADQSDELADNDNKDGGVTTHIPLDVRKIFSDLNPPFDMASQCRAVADWLNFKLVQAGLQSASISDTDQGILAASSQWHRHCQLFLKGEDVNNPSWSHWSYTAHQRHVMSQLVERFPIRENILSLGGMAKEEVIMRCSPWRHYMAAAEAQLTLGALVRKAIALTDTKSTVTEAVKERFRGQFVGGLTSEGLIPLLQEEGTRNHIDMALGMLKRSIARFEREIEKKRQEHSSSDDESDDKDDDASHRSGARLYYLAGGILFGKKDYKNAIDYLEKAIKYVHGWKDLELVIRRMLIECYESHLTTQTTEVTSAQSETIASMILDSYFNSKMSSRNLRRALNNFSSLTSADERIKWHRKCFDESDSSLPFSFAVTFPGTTHATAGDSVTASVMIQSNLDYAVHINSVTLLSMAGEVAVPPNSLLRAQNANEGTDGGIIIQAKRAIFLSTPIDVPNDLSAIATDESGNGGEKEGTAGKGSFAKSARPRSAGLTSAAGARLISENRFEKAQQDRSSQWSVHNLGGKPLRCDGLCLVFYPVHVEKAVSTDGASKVNLIELTIEKQRQRTAAKIKRTPFEEDNYLSSAWDRPADLHLSQGPRCLRVLGPMPQMVASNLTDTLTGGKTIEGTVNRIVIKLQAGPNEICEDIKYTVKCSSMLLSLDGTTQHLDDDVTTDDCMVDGKVRNPSLVSNDQAFDDRSPTRFGYVLPKGWKLVGSGRGTESAMAPSLSSIKNGEESFFYFDLYRPHRSLPPLSDVDETNSRRSAGSGVLDQDQLCQTDFDVIVTYKQGRAKAVQTLANRRRRQRPQENQESNAADESDIVSLDYTGSVVWTSPLSSDFSAVDVAQKAPPSGTRHQSNVISEEGMSQETKEDDDAFQLVLVDGERASTRCSLWANEMPSDIGIVVSRVWFQETDPADQHCECEFRLVGEQAHTSTLYEAVEKDVCKQLGKNKKIAVMLTTESHIKDKHRLSHVATNMGILCVDWSPSPLLIQASATQMLGVEHHGPLPLVDPSTVQFRGPACYIESPPFSTSISVEPSTPSVGIPFEVLYRVMNKTNIHQQFSVVMKEGNDTPDILVAGSVKGELRLSPRATQLLSYTAVATKAGKVVFPSVTIASDRYKTWLVHGAELTELYVHP